MRLHELMDRLSLILLLLLPYPALCRLQKLRMSGTQGGVSLGSAIVEAVMRSPLYTPIVSIARDTMVKTATSAGLDWEGKARLLTAAVPDWMMEIAAIQNENPDLIPPAYYNNKFHGYKEGNLCLQAAVEQELAGKAVGARNFPSEGLGGEEVLRGSYDREILQLTGATLPDDAIIVDFGSGTGTSTRRMARLFPQARSVFGLDMSPHMVAVGRYLGSHPDLDWVENIVPDARVSLQYADITATGLNAASVDMVSICLVLHELPSSAVSDVLLEAHRILKPGGVLVIMEMDPEAPGYQKLRATPWLFSILRSTEPWLDEYFDLAPKLPSLLATVGFPVVKISAATGRHFAIAAYKAGVIDLRPSKEKRARDDQHVNTLQKSVSKG
jgi:ubiquinone/menaquinone biosynthesis C-methylase UbiE